MINEIKNIKEKFKTMFDNSDVVLDIETFDFKTDKGIVRKIYNIGLLNSKTCQGLSFTIKENIELLMNNLSKENCYKLKLYYNNLESSYLLSEDYIKTMFENTTFKKLIGYNIVNFDIPILVSNDYQIKTSNIIDLYFLVSQCLPKKYLKFCQENNLLTEKKNPSFNAEAVYKFIKQCSNFKERHTALYDCLIENTIYKYCKKRIKIANITSKFNYLNIWKNYIKRFKKLNWKYNSYFKKIIEQGV